jgi:hypothetical protein
MEILDDLAKTISSESFAKTQGRVPAQLLE